jgi:hypothetical protein
MRTEVYPPDLLDPGERMVWSGRPTALSYATTKGRGSFLSGIFVCGFAAFWINSAYRQGGLFALFGVPIAVMGLGSVLSPLWYFVRARRTTYVLSDKRAIIDIAGLFPKRLSVPLSQVQFVELKTSNGGAGDVLFREVTSSWERGYSTTRDGFIAVPDTAEVDRLLRAAVAKAGNTRAASP